MKEYKAAVRIQSWFRGCLVRAFYANLHANAIIIQASFRGHLGRIEYRRRLEKCLDDMRIEYYKEMATRIQRNWRGYYVRRYVFNYRAYKEYLRGVVLINEITRSRIKEEREREEREQAEREEKIQELQEQEEARRHHYMLSTFTKGGIFQQDPKRPLHPFEERMRSIQFASPVGSRRRNKKKSQIVESALLSSTTRTQTTPTTQAATSIDQQQQQQQQQLVSVDTTEGKGVLPPLVKMQGPFKAPEEVRRLKCKPLKPTLRVATPYDCEQLRRIEMIEEEWRNRIIDKRFVPFSHRHYSYDPMLHPKTSYHGHISYCNAGVRASEPPPGKSISTRPFQTVLRPLATFDELNST